MGSSFALMCLPNKQQELKKSCIDSTLQESAESLLKEKMEEIDAYTGQVIVMETKTGRIRTMVSMKRIDSSEHWKCADFATQQYSGLARAYAYLAVLESRKIHLSDKVDTGEGLYLMIN